MKMKLMGLMGSLIAVFLFLSLWKMEGSIFPGEFNWLEAQLRSQSFFLGALIEKDLEKEKKQILYQHYKKNDGTLAWDLFPQYEALVEFKQVGSQLEFLRFYRRGLQFPLEALLDSFQLEFSKEYRSQKKNQKSLSTDSRFLTATYRGKIYSALFIEKAGFQVALLREGSPLQNYSSWIQSWGLGKSFITTQRGVLVQHSESHYVGTKILDQKMWMDYKESAENFFQTQNGAQENLQVQALLIPQTNLILFSEVPLSPLLNRQRDMKWQFTLMAVGLLFLGFAGAYHISGAQMQGLSLLQKRVRGLLKGEVVSVAPQLIQDPKVREIDALLESYALSEKTKGFLGSSAGDSVIQNEEGGAENRAKDYAQVAASLAHEFKSPLLSIMGYSQSLLSLPLAEEVKELTESILRESRQMKSVLDKLFLFSGELPSEKVDASLDQCVEKALGTFKSSIEAKGIRIHREIERGILVPMVASHLKMAFENIIKNSLEAMERMPKKDLFIKIYKSSEEVCVEIEDTGEGIESQYLEKIRDPFFTTRSFSNHVGLGLTLTSSILKDHGVSLNFISERKRGTCVKMLFPQFKEVEVQEPLGTMEEAPAPLISNLVMPSNLDLSNPVELGSNIRTSYPERPSSLERSFSENTAEKNSLSSMHSMSPGISAREARLSNLENESALLQQNLDELFALPESSQQTAEASKKSKKNILHFMNLPDFTTPTPSANQRNSENQKNSTNHSQAGLESSIKNTGVESGKSLNGRET